MRTFRLNIGLGKRIYLAMLAIILVSSLAVGIFTIYFFKNQNEDYHEKRLLRKEERIAKSIEFFLDRTEDVKPNLNNVPRSLHQKVDELSALNDIGINIYNLDGEILFYFTPVGDTFSELEPVIHEVVLSDLREEKTIVHIEEISADHLATYSYIRNANREKIAILKIPYHDFSTQSLEFSDFYRALIQVYIFLLIGASIFAYFFSKSITRSLVVIGDNMKNVSIGKKNERIEWKNKDEIGQLVNQYNSMIDQVEQSAQLLAQSERESAWREMAKQVAHEIKNPLTPMKLNVQFLEHTLKPTTEDFGEKMKKFSEKMITQIDALTNIANEFSSFAKMPSTSLEKVDLLNIITVSKETFKSEIDINLQNEVGEEIIIDGDQDQLVRVFNNLLKNAVQSIPEKTKGTVLIHVSEKNEVLTIEIKDNGKGIPPDQYNNIFIPNFTTKSSGSGLGLAMVKNIMKNHKGIIWFESKVGVGTSFFLEFPFGKN